MPCCSAAGCSNRHEDGIRLFRWPGNQERTRQWLEQCDRDDSWKPTASSRLCEKHFDSEQFEAKRTDDWRKLKPNAIPTIFAMTEKWKQLTVKSKGSYPGCDTDASKMLLFNNSSGVTSTLHQTMKQKYDDTSENRSVSNLLDDEDHDCFCLTLDMHVSSESEFRQQTTNANTSLDSALSSASFVANVFEHTYSRCVTQVAVMSRLFECPLCHQLVTRLAQLRAHLRQHSLHCTPSSLPVRRHTCRICSKQFGQRAVLLTHVAVLHPGYMSEGSSGTLSGTCARPPQDTSVVSPAPDVDPQATPLTDSDKLRHLCPACGLRFARRTALHRHQRVHTGERRYLCAACGLRFGSCSALSRHATVHAGARPLVCTFCCHRFAHVGDLRRHMHVHTSDRPFACTVCHRNFARSNCLAAHMRRCHGGVNGAVQSCHRVQTDI